MVRRIVTARENYNTSGAIAPSPVANRPVTTNQKPSPMAVGEGCAGMVMAGESLPRAGDPAGRWLGLERNRGAFLGRHQAEAITTVEIDQRFVFDVDNHVNHAVIVDIAEIQNHWCAILGAPK